MKLEHLSHTDYNLIFDNNIVEGVQIELLEIGDVHIKSGKVVACDPLVYYDTSPFIQTVKKGKFPVKIYIAKTKDWGDRYSIAKLEFSPKRAVKWVLALQDGDNIDELTEPLDYFGFGVDAGLGGFFDAEAGILLSNFIDELMDKNPNGNAYDDFFATEFKKNAEISDADDCGNWINFQLPNSDLNITMFQSGYGDGSYPCYWGIDENEEVVSLVIDFLVLLVPEE